MVVEVDIPECCEECIFWKAAPSGQHGYCRESPPVFTTLDEAGRPKFYSPVVSPWNWCGRFEPVDD